MKNSTEPCTVLGSASEVFLIVFGSWYQKWIWYWNVAGLHNFFVYYTMHMFNFLIKLQVPALSHRLHSNHHTDAHPSETQAWSRTEAAQINLLSTTEHTNS